MEEVNPDAEEAPASAEITDDLHRPDVPSCQKDKMKEISNRSDDGSHFRKDMVFIDDIKVGDVYDVLDSSDRWCEGEVTKIDHTKCRAFVSYLYWDSKFDEWVELLSKADHQTNDVAMLSGSMKYRLAPLNTHTFYKGGPLRIGQRIEALDETNAWLEAHIIDHNENQVLVHFKGYHPKFDTWIPCSAADDGSRIRPYGHSKPPRRMSDTSVVIQKISNREVISARNLHRKLWKVPYNSMPGKSKVDVEYGRVQGATNYGNKSSSSTYFEPERKGKQISQDLERCRKISEVSEQYLSYTHALERHGLSVVPVIGDGNCLFRAVAHQIYGDEELHRLVRQKCIEYMEAESDFFCQFVEGGKESFPFYLQAKRSDGCWGDDPEIEALCELYNRAVEIWAYDPGQGARKLRTFHEQSQLVVDENCGIDTCGRNGCAMRLSYYGGGHYDSIVPLSTSTTWIYREANGRALNDSESSNSYRTPGEMEDLSIENSLRKRYQQPHLATNTIRAAGRPVSCQENSSQPARYTEFDQLRDEYKKDEEKARNISDQEATEQLTLNHALEESRRMVLEGSYDDLETCLLLCMQENGDSEPTKEFGSQASTVEVTMQTAEQPRSDATDPVVSDVQKLSEEEYINSEILQNALHGSIKTESVVGNDTDLADRLLEQQIEDAKRESLKSSDINNLSQGGNSNDADLDLAILMSVANRAGPLLSTHSRDESDMSHPASEDQMLQLALAESLRGTERGDQSRASAMQRAGSSSISESYRNSSTIISHHSEQSSNALRNSSAMEDMDEDLMRAIEESLKHK